MTQLSSVICSNALAETTQSQTECTRDRPSHQNSPLPSSAPLSNSSGLGGGVDLSPPSLLCLLAQTCSCIPLLPLPPSFQSMTFRTQVIVSRAVGMKVESSCFKDFPLESALETESHSTPLVSHRNALMLHSNARRIRSS